MIGAPFLLLVSSLQMAPALQTPVGNPDPTVHFHTGLELGGLALSSGTVGGGMDAFGLARPHLSVKGGEDFEFELGASLRVRLLDQAPLQTEQDHGGRLRREDWDEPSDFGQILRRLRIGRDSGQLQLKAGEYSTYSLGAGWLVSRYDNRLSPDYHPAGANLIGYLGPVRAELFASDVLATRLFAGEVRLDMGRIMGAEEPNHDRYLLALDVAHDFGTAGGTSPSLSAASLGAHFAVVKSETLQLWLQAGLGARAETLVEAVPDYGVAVGAVVAGKPEDSLELTGRLEARRQEGGFRFGLFGADHELARFSGVGLGEVPLAQLELVEPTYSGYGEFAAAVSPGGPEDLDLTASASGEYFVGTGQLDVDVALRASLPGGKTEAQLRAMLTDVLVRPRYSVVGEVRHRFLPAVYGFAMGGTQHFPQADGSLVRGFTGGLGVGVDFQR